MAKQAHRLIECPCCYRSIPVEHDGTIRKHYLQSKGWERWNGERDYCDNSGVKVDEATDGRGRPRSPREIRAGRA